MRPSPTVWPTTVRLLAPRFTPIPLPKLLCLDAVRQDMLTDATHPIPPNLAPAAGEAPFTPQEVLQQLQQAEWFTSPGWDGLPSPCGAPSIGRNFWRACTTPASTATGCLRASYLDGTITPLLKPGAPDATQPGTCLCLGCPSLSFPQGEWPRYQHGQISCSTYGPYPF